MLTNPLRRAATALTLATALAACGDAATDPTDAGVSASVAAATTLDVATVAGDAAAEDVETFKVHRGAFGLATIDFERFSRWESCPYDATAERFVCVSRSRGPFSHSRSYVYLDEAGAPQRTYSASTTAATNFRWSLSGTITRERWNGSVSRERDITISGLLGDNSTVVVNGRSASERQRTRFLRDGDGPNGLTREYDMEATTLIANVVTPSIRMPDAWPASGTITRTYSVTRTDATNGTIVTTRNSVVTFNGTQFALLVVNDREFTLDLATGRVTPKATA